MSNKPFALIMVGLVLGGSCLAGTRLAHSSADTHSRTLPTIPLAQKNLLLAQEAPSNAPPPHRGSGRCGWIC